MYAYCLLHVLGRHTTEDDGHEHWLKSLQTKKGAAAAFLARLQVRKQHLVAEAEYEERLRQIELAAWEDLRTAPVYGVGGQGRRVDWTSTHTSIAPAPKAQVRPVPSPRVDPWNSAMDLEGQRRAPSWQATPPHKGAGGDSGSCVSVLYAVFKWLLTPNTVCAHSCRLLSSGSSRDGCCCAFGWDECLAFCTIPKRWASFETETCVLYQYRQCTIGRPT